MLITKSDHNSNYVISPEQNGHHFADNIFKHIFLNENVIISIEILLKFVPKDPIDSKGSSNGLVLNRHQSITWTNAHPEYNNPYMQL